MISSNYVQLAKCNLLMRTNDLTCQHIEEKSGTLSSLYTTGSGHNLSRIYAVSKRIRTRSEIWPHVQQVEQFQAIFHQNRQVALHPMQITDLNWKVRQVSKEGILECKYKCEYFWKHINKIYSPGFIRFQIEAIENTKTNKKSNNIHNNVHSVSQIASKPKTIDVV